MAINSSKSGGGKPPSKPGRGGKASKAKAKSKAKSGKPAYTPVKPGHTSPGLMSIVSPKPVKSPGDHSSNKGHVFGYYRMGIEKRKT